MRSLMIIGLFFLLPCTAVGQQITFKCSLQNADKGWRILVSNAGPGPRTCTASCEALDKDGKSLQFGNCGPKAVRQGANDELFCGNETASNNPLKNPKITAFSCN